MYFKKQNKLAEYVQELLGFEMKKPSALGMC